MLLKTQTAMQKIVVDTAFKNDVMKDKDPQARQAAAEVSDVVKNASTSPPSHSPGMMRGCI